ncbi:MAG: AAA family ATPase [Candidatus Pacebacteria bacterium]|nr:AAA family ATPase [Candidatus Paceibacterota bacterium]
MNILLQTYQRLLSEVQPEYYRQFYTDFSLDNRFVGVVGARGVGKTTFLLQYLREHYDSSEKGLYVSADNLYFSNHTLLETVDAFVTLHGGELLCIDEIHRYKNWNQELKNIYDSYPKLTVIFSGSSSIDLIKGKYDLSRRVILKHMHGFSFREFLEIKTGDTYPILSLTDILKTTAKTKKIAETNKLLGYLHEYWQKGYYPTALTIPTKDAFWDTLLGIIDKTIYEDVSAFYNLKTENLESLKKLVYFFATARPGSISVNRLANTLDKDHSTTASYIQMLRDTGLLRFLLNDKQGHALVRNAEKVYLDNPNLTFAVINSIGKQVQIGSIRELFVISALENAGYKVQYSKTGDITCDGTIFEIGGANKTDQQIKQITNSYLVKDDLLYATLQTIPLYLFGFLS